MNRSNRRRCVDESLDALGLCCSFKDALHTLHRFRDDLVRVWGERDIGGEMDDAVAICRSGALVGVNVATSSAPKMESVQRSVTYRLLLHRMLLAL